MSKEAEEIRLCRLFLLDSTHHPDNPSKSIKKGMGPYKSWMEKCDKHKDALQNNTRSPTKSATKSVARSPTKSVARSPQKNDTYMRNRFVDTEELNRDLILKERLRPMKYNLPLLSLVHLTVDDFEMIRNEPYDSFIDEVIKITNNNGGNITKYYMNQIAGYDIIIEIPKKYTSKQTGNNTVKFYDDKGITNGRLLYNLASYIKSNYSDYYYFTGLNKDNGNIYKLMINYESW